MIKTTNLKKKNRKAPGVIYLIDGEEENEFLWCEDPAPGAEQKEEDAVRYIRDDIVITSRKEQVMFEDRITYELNK